MRPSGWVGGGRRGAVTPLLSEPTNEQRCELWAAPRERRPRTRPTGAESCTTAGRLARDRLPRTIRGNTSEARVGRPRRAAEQHSWPPAAADDDEHRARNGKARWLELELAPASSKGRHTGRRTPRVSRESGARLDGACAACSASVHGARQVASAASGRAARFQSRGQAPGWLTQAWRLCVRAATKATRSGPLARLQ
jgi:hypothetical protein